MPMPDEVQEPENYSAVCHAGDDESVAEDDYGEDSDADSPEQDC